MLGEVSSFDSFFCGNVFKIKLDMTFSRLPVEKYFLIPEGALGNGTAWQPGLPGQGMVGRLSSMGYIVIHCTGSSGKWVMGFWGHLLLSRSSIVFVSF